MAEFKWRASYGAEGTVTASVTRLKFGDGYEQRFANGINSLPRSWSLQWQNVKSAVGDQIVGFLAARGGVEAFAWQPPSGDSGKWVCETWKVRRDHPGLATVSATFEEVFE